MNSDIRPATEEDLVWLRNGIDPEALREMKQREIEATLRSTPTPPHWRFPDNDAPTSE